MKKILLFVLTLWMFSAKAQTSVYHPFPDSNATWCCEKAQVIGCCICAFPDYDTYGTYKLNGDTLVNGIVYHKLLYYEILYDRCNPDTTTFTTTYLIRQDTATKKIWMYYSFVNRDTILFDFDLHVGDTLDASKEFWAGLSIPCIVSSIDSVSINGQYRKRFNYYPTFDSLCISSMIEGIGSIHGLLYPPSSCFEYYATLHIFMQDNQVILSDGSTFQFVCHDFSAGINSINATNISITISPNPFHTTSTLKLNTDFENANLKIYNVLGEMVQQQKINSQSTIINRNELSNGIYFFSLINNKGNVAGGKFIVE